MYKLSFLLEQQVVPKEIKPKSKTAIKKFLRLMKKVKALFHVNRQEDILFDCIN